MLTVLIARQLVAQLKLHVLANPNMAFVRSQMVDPKTNEPLLPICMDKDPTTGQALTDAQRRALIKENGEL